MTSPVRRSSGGLRTAKLLAGCAVALAGAGLGAGDGLAQEPARGVSVFERPRPDYDPVGVRAGSFLVLPKVELAQSYNDNIFATDSDEDSDFITIVSPLVEVQSDWSRHQVSFNAGADAGFYWDHTDEDYIDTRLALDGRVDILRETYAFLGVGWSHLHEPRDSPDDVEGEKPTEYELYSATAGAFRGLGRISTRLDFNLDRYDWHDVDAQGGGEIDEDERDRNQYTLTGQVGYEYLPDTEAFVRVIPRYVDYDETEQPEGIDRDSRGIAAVVGTDLNFTGKTSGEAFVGYQWTEYDDPSFNSSQSPAAGLNLLWNATSLTSVRPFIQGNLEETTDEEAASYVAARAGVGVEHELRRNVLVGGNVTLGRDDYQDTSREDDIFEAGLEARYLINRNFYAGAEYTFQTRNSDEANEDFSENVFLVRIGAQL